MTAAPEKSASLDPRTRTLIEVYFPSVEPRFTTIKQIGERLKGIYDAVNATARCGRLNI
jgi:hypothetical protein